MKRSLPAIYKSKPNVFSHPESGKVAARNNLSAFNLMVSTVISRNSGPPGSIQIELNESGASLSCPRFLAGSWMFSFPANDKKVASEPKLGALTRSCMHVHGIGSFIFHIALLFFIKA